MTSKTHKEPLRDIDSPDSIVSVDSFEFETAANYSDDKTITDDSTDGRRRNKDINSYADNKNVAEGLMDIALLSANANQLRFLLKYNYEASTYYISLGLVALSLILQVVVGIVLIFRRRMKCGRDKRFVRTNEFLVGGVFMVTVVNILLAAFTTTDVGK
ncbi:ninjurin-1 [Teleopsis dalmanni]|uniref:ninjurin-1 n=1 Tax=Teleopsis dalmanni TaxID=139649 RepID=UPI0018CFE326|nr:ninjurin-1 [Teleopsis dalmanni]